MTDKERSLELHQSGLNYSEIGRILGRNKGVIRRWLRPDVDVYEKKRHSEYRKSDSGKAYAALHRSRAYAKKFGYAPCTLSNEELRALYTDNCEICKVAEVDCNTRLHLDHDHVTGKFRGWLCNDCNILLGRAKDNPDILRSAADYLDKANVSLD